MRPPFETFKNPTCRGSFVLGSACGHCEKCQWERQHMTLNLDIAKTAEEREAERLRRIEAGWDGWYTTLPDDLKRRLSLHDFKRLGECFRQAFGIERVTPPDGWPGR